MAYGLSVRHGVKAPSFIATIWWCSSIAAGPATVLYDNGPLSTGKMTASGVPAPPDTTWSEVASDQPSSANAIAGFGHQADPSYNNRVADDFTITDPDGWLIESICFFAYQTGSSATSSPFVAVNLRIWDGVPESTGSSIVFGDATTNRLVSTTFADMYRIFHSTEPPPGQPPDASRPVFVNEVSTLDEQGQPLELSPGTYWLDWQTDGVLISGPWAPAVTVPGVRSQVNWNARQFIGHGENIGWLDALDPGLPSSRPDVAQDFPFQIKGRMIAPPCPADIAGGKSGGDGVVNVTDLLAVIQQWGACPNPCPPRCSADIVPATGDCTVNVTDLLAVIAAWGACP